MIDNDEAMQKYGFMYVDCDNKVYRKEIETAGATWHECLNDYVRFLESIFGYSIMDQVRIKEPVWLDIMYDNYPDYIDPWTGAYFKDGDDGEGDKDAGNNYAGNW